MVTAARGRVPSVEAHRGSGCADDGDVVGEHRVESLGGSFRRRATGHVDRDDLGEGVDARIRATGNGEVGPVAVEPIERCAQRTFDRAKPRLSGPATEPGSVVLEC